jgi:ATP synthase F0 subunit c
MESVACAKYIGAGIAICLGGLGCGFGEGLIAGKASESMVRQPKASGEIVRTMLITQAITETACIFGLLVAIMLLFVVPSQGGLSVVAACIGAGICMGAGAIGSGIGPGIGGAAACESIARHPAQSVSILLTTLIGQAIAQTGAIFALVVSLLLTLMTPDSARIEITGAIIGASFSMGLGAIGVGVGSGHVIAMAVKGTARNAKAGSLLLRIMLLGQAVAHTMAICSMIIAFLLILIGK